MEKKEKKEKEKEKIKVINVNKTLPTIECPICLSKECIIKVNCDHTFCSNCIFTHSLGKKEFSKLCPICRTPITTLFYYIDYGYFESDIRPIVEERYSKYMSI